MSNPAYWYISRAAGFTAMIALTISVLLGVAATTRATSAIPRVWTQQLHRAAGIGSLLLLAIHVLTITQDRYVHVTLVDGVLPFRSSFNRTGVGLGTLAADVILLVIATSLLRRRLNPTLWRAIHLLTYPAWVLAVAHGLLTGTDRHLTAVRLGSFIALALVGSAMVWRLAEEGRAWRRSRA